jgi:hypothetical protein
MAMVNVLIRRRPDQVWAVLADGSAYDQWVVGTRMIRSVDDGWPALGTAIHYSAGIGPLTLRGTTTVRRLDKQRELGLEADAGLLGSVRIAIELSPWGEDTLVVVDEHPLRGPAYWLHNPVADSVLLLRGGPMMRNLARLVERRFPRTDGGAG